MIAEQTFDERMAKLSDEELYDVLANEADYLPEAIDAAKKEIQNRNLSSEKLAEFETHVQEKQQAETEKAGLPLSWPIRIFMFLFPLGVAQILVSEYYRNQGYQRKAKECWTWMGYGILFYIALIILPLFRVA